MQIKFVMTLDIFSLLGIHIVTFILLTPFFSSDEDVQHLGNPWLRENYADASFRRTLQVENSRSGCFQS